MNAEHLLITNRLVRLSLKFHFGSNMRTGVFAAKRHLPGTGPQTRGIISRIAEHDGSSKHN